MGMFDYLRCEIPTDIGDKQCQTKDTSAQFLDNYLIKADGTLWHEEYDIEDHSDPNATGLERIIGSMERVNQRWVQEFITGEIVFYYWNNETKTSIDYSAYFVKGILKGIHNVSTQV